MAGKRSNQHPEAKTKHARSEDTFENAYVAIREKDQKHVAAILSIATVNRDTMLVLLLRYNTSEFGTLHAEKYYRTVNEKFALTLTAFHLLQLVCMGRVMASSYGKTAAGHNEARHLLGLA